MERLPRATTGTARCWLRNTDEPYNQPTRDMDMLRHVIRQREPAATAAVPTHAGSFEANAAPGGESAMNDTNILHRITELVSEEHELENKGEHGGLDDEEHARMKSLAVNLDQCWDLLRQRRARRHAGQNPNEAEVRPASVVEHYQQ